MLSLVEKDTSIIIRDRYRVLHVVIVQNPGAKIQLYICIFRMSMSI